MRKRLKLDEDGGDVDMLENVKCTNPCVPGLLNLSDDILLIILSNISHFDLVNLSMTCNRLGSVANDYTLWKKVDFGQPLRLHQLRRCLPFLRSTTVSMVIHGFANRGRRRDTTSVSPTLFMQVITSCPQLHTLTLNKVYMSCKEINIIHFPNSLTYLSLEECEIKGETVNNRFFTNINKTFPNLQVLVLTNCTWLASHSLMAISKCEKLRELYLNGCKRLNRCVAYTSMAAQLGFKALETLDLRNTLLTDSEVSSFSNCLNIKHLFLECPAPTYAKVCTQNVADGLPPVHRSTVKRRFVRTQADTESVSCGKGSAEKSSSVSIANRDETSCDSAADNKPSGSGHNTRLVVIRGKQDEATCDSAEDKVSSGSGHNTLSASSSGGEGSVGNAKPAKTSHDSAAGNGPSGSGHNGRVVVIWDRQDEASSDSAEYNGPSGSGVEEWVDYAKQVEASDSAEDNGPSGSGHNTLSASSSVGKGSMGNAKQDETSRDFATDNRPSASRVVAQDEVESDDDMEEVAENNNNSVIRLQFRQGQVQVTSNTGVLRTAPSTCRRAQLVQDTGFITDKCFMSMVPNPGDGYVRIVVSNSIRLPQLCTIVARNFKGVTDRSLHFFNQMKALRHLDVTGTKITKTALLNFIFLRPEIKVVSSFTDLNKM